jgi:hypothetical protein
MSIVTPATIASKMVALAQDKSGVASVAVSTLSQEQQDKLAEMKVALFLLGTEASSVSLISGEVSLSEIVGE